MTATSDLTSLLDYCAADGRVCPSQRQWHRLWKILPGRTSAGLGWKPALPLILGGWLHSSDAEKRRRLAEHVRWASERGQLARVDRMLRALHPGEWHHARDDLA